MDITKGNATQKRKEKMKMAVRQLSNAILKRYAHVNLYETCGIKTTYDSIILLEADDVRGKYIDFRIRGDKKHVYEYRETPRADGSIWQGFGIVTIKEKA